MKKIRLTQGKWALVDDADFGWLNRSRWHTRKNGKTFYARTNIGRGSDRSTLLMHVAILGSRPGLEIDHRDQNGLNNQRRNLRFLIHKENCRNLPKREGHSSVHSGVYWHKATKKWVAQIGRKHLGCFAKELDALKARRKAEKTLWKK